jgi:hypothetical protein
MGLIIAVKCDACSYYDEMFAGGIRTTPFKEWQWPVFCRGCRSIATSRFSDGPLKCLKCGSDDAVAMDDPTVYVGGGDHVMHSWVGGQLPNTRQVMHTKKVEVHGWRRVRQWLLRKLVGPSADWDVTWTEEPDRERHEIRNGYYLCPRCREKELRFPICRQARAIFH